MVDIYQMINVQEEKFDQIYKGKRNFNKSPKQRITLSYLETRLEALEETWQAFKSGHDQLISCVKKESKNDLKYFSEDLYNQCEELYIEYKSELKNELKKNAPKSEIQPAEKQQKTTEINLPTIKIPIFSGRYTEWPSFHDLFYSLIHTNKHLHDVQKLHYLKSSVAGEAEQLLRSISITSQNYEQAWSTLKNRYNNKRFLSNSIFKKLFSLKSIASESATSIRQLIDSTVECLNALNNLGLPTEAWSAIIIYMTVTKLDSDSHRLWEQHISQDDDFPAFDKLQQFLETRFRSLEMTEYSSKTVKTRSFHTAFDKTLPTCSYCKESHYIYQCKQFGKLSYKDRSEFVQTHNLCFNCLIPNHLANRCLRNTSCRVCQKKHHSLLHPERREPVSEESQKDQTNIVSHFTKQPGQILLATALVDVTSSHGNRHTYRALIDQGSQASFVSEDLVQTLGLKREKINGVVTGLSGGSQLQTKYMVEVNLTSKIKTNFTLNVKAYVVRNITTYLPTQQIVMSNWPELENIALADPGFNIPNKIQILLGAEIYGKIIDVGLLKSPSGSIIAQSTYLGWILSGDTNDTNSEKQKQTIRVHVCIFDNELLKKF